MKAQVYLKAIYAAVISGLGSFAVAVADNVVTTQEWVTVAIATVTAAGVVWGVPNAKSGVAGAFGKATPPSA
jgi:hypothetical protein